MASGVKVLPPSLELSVTVARVLLPTSDLANSQVVVPTGRT